MRAVKIIPFNPMQKDIKQKIQLEVEMLQLLVGLYTKLGSSKYSKDTGVLPR